MSHEVETMAFAHELPWHGLGNRVDASVSIEEMLTASGLDWGVGLHPIFAQVGDTAVRVPNKSALIRETDNKVLTTASDKWVPVQNREVLEFFREYTRAGGATLETAGSLNGGKTVWGLANLGHGFTVGSGDAVKGYVLLASHHEMGKATTVRLTSVRVVCANTMAMAVRGAKAAYSQNHLASFDAEAARNTLGLAHEGMVQMEKNAKLLAKLNLTPSDTVRVLAPHFMPLPDEAMAVDDVRQHVIDKLLSDATARSKSLHEVLLSNEQAPGAMPGTGWGVLNAVTYWADHVAGRDKGARMAKSWFGSTGDVKLAVERDLLAMAG
jgi:phage/plasmid-like protein (TIGR03299 family)